MELQFRILRVHTYCRNCGLFFTNNRVQKLRFVWTKLADICFESVGSSFSIWVCDQLLLNGMKFSFNSCKGLSERWIISLLFGFIIVMTYPNSKCSVECSVFIILVVCQCFRFWWTYSSFRYLQDVHYVWSSRNWSIQWRRGMLILLKCFLFKYVTLVFQKFYWDFTLAPMMAPPHVATISLTHMCFLWQNPIGSPRIYRWSFPKSRCSSWLSIFNPLILYFHFFMRVLKLGKEPSRIKYSVEKIQILLLRCKVLNLYLRALALPTHDNHIDSTYGINGIMLRFQDKEKHC